MSNNDDPTSFVSATQGRSQGMLLPIIFLYVTSYVSARMCDRNQFWSMDLARCENCSRCTNPDIVIRPCQDNKDTVCGPFSELHLDWSFLTHSDSRNSNPQKEMMQTFKENFREIRQHEKHVLEKQRMRQRQRKHHRMTENENEIEGGDIFVGNRHRAMDEKKILEKIKELSRRGGPNGEDHEKSMKLFQTLLDLPVVLDSFSNNPLRFDNEEASELLRNGKKTSTTTTSTTSTTSAPEIDSENYDPNELKFNDKGILLKDFGFSKPDPEVEAVRVEKLVENTAGTHEKGDIPMSREWRFAIAAGVFVSHAIVILVVATYCIRSKTKKSTGYFVPDLGEIQTWVMPRDKERKYTRSSCIYKPTTEIRASTSGGKCKYLERLINVNTKKKVNFYVGVRLPPEMKPLTRKYPGMHIPIGDRV